MYISFYNTQYDTIYLIILTLDIIYNSRVTHVPAPPNLHDTYEISCPPHLLPSHCIQPIIAPYNCLLSISCTNWRWPLSSAETCSCTLCSKYYIHTSTIKYSCVKQVHTLHLVYWTQRRWRILWSFQWASSLFPTRGPVQLNLVYKINPSYKSCWYELSSVSYWMWWQVVRLYW